MLRTIHGIVASSAGGGPSEPTSFALEHPGAASTAMFLTWSLPVDLAGGVTGYQIIKDGSVLVADTATSTRSYKATGLTVSTSYSFQVAAISASGVGAPCAALSKSTIAPASISWSGTNQAFYDPTGQDGYIVYQARGSGSFYVSSNPASAPISVWVVGGGGGAYNPWVAPSGGGGGAVYWLDEATNIPVGSSHTMTFALGAGASGSATNGATSSTCTNLHYSGGSWSTVTAGRGGSQAGGPTMDPEHGGAGSGAYVQPGYVGTQLGNAGHGPASAGNTGGTGGYAVGSGAGTSYSGPGWSVAGGGGGGSVGRTATFPGTGGVGMRGYGWAPSGCFGGYGGQGFAFSATDGMGLIHGGQGSSAGGYITIDGIGGGGGGSSFGCSNTSYSAGGQGGYSYHGGARAVHTSYRAGGGGFTGPSGQANPYAPTGDRNYHGLLHSGGGGASVANGYVYYGNGGSGGVYVRLHT
jgi:hypothetical protein